jgi:hypothetical protein
LIGALMTNPKSAQANAIVPIGRGICADMVLPSPFSDNVLTKFEHNRMQIGQSRVGFGHACVEMLDRCA